MAIYEDDEYRIEVRMVCDDGRVFLDYTALEPTDRDTAMKYWAEFYDALCDVFEKNLFDKSLDK